MLENRLTENTRSIRQKLPISYCFDAVKRRMEVPLQKTQHYSKDKIQYKRGFASK